MLTSMKRLLPVLMALAEQGDSDAQFNLGLMFEKGQGVLQDTAYFFGN